MVFEPTSEWWISRIVSYHIWNSVLSLAGLVLEGMGSWLFGCFSSSVCSDSTGISTPSEVSFHAVTVVLEVLITRTQASHSEEQADMHVVDAVLRMTGLEVQICV